MSAVDSKRIAITAKLEKVGADWRVQVTAGADDLILRENNGRKSAALELVFAQRSAQGAVLEQVASALNLDLDTAHSEESPKTILLGAFNVAPKPGLTEIKIVLMDLATGNIGSLAAPIGL